MPKNHCLIQFNITTKMWEGSHNGQVLVTSADMRVVQSEMFSRGYNIQNVATATDPDFVESVMKNGCG